MRTITIIAVALLLAVLFGVSDAADASCRTDISRLTGWEIVYSGTVTGYIDDNGKEQDEFEGCEYGRVLIIDYSNTVTCQEYSYAYAYMPDVVIVVFSP